MLKLSCDHCQTQFEIEKMEDRPAGVALFVRGFSCPSCSHWYQVAVVNTAIQKLEQERTELTQHLSRLQTRGVKGEKVQRLTRRALILLDKQKKLMVQINPGQAPGPASVQ